jgi:hypothetical protein
MEIFVLGQAGKLFSPFQRNEIKLIMLISFNKGETESHSTSLVFAGGSANLSICEESQIARRLVLTGLEARRDVVGQPLRTKFLCSEAIRCTAVNTLDKEFMHVDHLLRINAYDQPPNYQALGSAAFGRCHGCTLYRLMSRSSSRSNPLFILRDRQIGFLWDQVFMYFKPQLVKPCKRPPVGKMGLIGFITESLIEKYIAATRCKVPDVAIPTAC